MARLTLEVADSFRRIRYYGFLAPRLRAQTCARCRQCLASTTASPIAADTGNPTAGPMRRDGRPRVSMRPCPACGRGHLIVIDRLPPPRRLSLVPDPS